MTSRGPARLLLAPPLPAWREFPPRAARTPPPLPVCPGKERPRRWEQRADLRMVQKRYLEAIDFYQQALALQPRDPILLNKVGIAHHQLAGIDEANFRKARKFYERAPQAAP